jgi:hypothetical protein
LYSSDQDPDSPAAAPDASRFAAIIPCEAELRRGSTPGSTKDEEAESEESYDHGDTYADRDEQGQHRRRNGNPESGRNLCADAIDRIVHGKSGRGDDAVSHERA